MTSQWRLSPACAFPLKIAKVRCKTCEIEIKYRPCRSICQGFDSLYQLKKGYTIWFQSRKALHNFRKLYSKRYWVNCFSLSTSRTVTTSTSFELPSSHARVTSIKFTKQQWVSESVSQWVSDKHNQWSDSGPIKMKSSKVAKNGVSLAHERLFFGVKRVRAARSSNRKVIPNITLTFFHNSK